MKKLLLTSLLLCATMLFLGCGSNTQDAKSIEKTGTTDQTSTETTEQSSNQLTTNTSTPTTLKEMQKLDDYTKQGWTYYMQPYNAVDTTEFPFAVDMRKVINTDYKFSDMETDREYPPQATFFLERMNFLDRITLDNTQTRSYARGTITFYYKNKTDTKLRPYVFLYAVREVPTTTITVENDREATEPTRTVEVNTEIKLQVTDSSDTVNFPFWRDKFYLFTNQSGGISLATPHFTNRTLTADKKEIMFEYPLEAWNK